MSNHRNTVLHSRRALLAVPCGVIVGAALGDGVTLSSPIPGPDDELIKLCDDLIQLDDQINSFPCQTLEQEDLAEELRVPLFTAQAPLFGMICDMKTVTLDGLRARARVIQKYMLDVATYDADSTQLMIAALLRDIVAS